MHVASWHMASRVETFYERGIRQLFPFPGPGRAIACCHPPLYGEGRTAEGSPGWGDGGAADDGDASYAEALPKAGRGTECARPALSICGACARPGSGIVTRMGGDARERVERSGRGDERLRAPRA